MAERVVAPRTVSPLLQKLRNILMGRTHSVENGSLRYTKFVSKRDQPPPILPEGPNHVVSNNPYHARDARRMVKPPEVVVENMKSKLLAATAESSQSKAVGSLKPRTPGKVFLWD